MGETKQSQSESQSLPPIIQRNNRPAVSAHELYNALGFAAQHRAKWYNKNILKNSFAIENQDWVKLPLSGRSKDYSLSLDFAKRLAMMARTDRGEQIRNYFIQCEQQALEATKPRSATELLLESVQILHAQETKLSGIEIRVHELEAKATTALGYYGIAGYAALKRRSIDIKTAAALGSKAKAAARKIGAIITTMPDPRFGRVNCYPEQILESVFNDFFNA